MVSFVFIYPGKLSFSPHSVITDKESNNNQIVNLKLVTLDCTKSLFEMSCKLPEIFWILVKTIRKKSTLDDFVC